MEEELEEQENEEGKGKEKKEAVKREKVGRGGTRKLKISFIIALCNLEKEKKRRTRRGEERTKKQRRNIWVWRVGWQLREV